MLSSLVAALLYQQLLYYSYSQYYLLYYSQSITFLLSALRALSCSSAQASFSQITRIICSIVLVEPLYQSLLQIIQYYSLMNILAREVYILYRYLVYSLLQYISSREVNISILSSLIGVAQYTPTTTLILLAYTLLIS